MYSRTSFQSASVIPAITNESVNQNEPGFFWREQGGMVMRIGSIVLGITSVALLAAGAMAQTVATYEDGVAAYKSGNFAQAFAGLLPIATAGDRLAQFYIASMYDEGDGVELDDAEAVKWYRMSADQGDVDAQVNLGIMYSEGEGVTEDDAEALRWFRRAAAQDDSDGEYLLGLMYKTGEGVDEDAAEALRWYRLAAASGHTDAQFEIGKIYDFGEGVAEDNEESVRWYRLAAEHGNADAQNFLGLSYETGEGVPKSVEEAFFWLSLAAKQDVEHLRDRDRVRSDLSSMQLVRIQRRLAEWSPILSDPDSSESPSEMDMSGDGGPGGNNLVREAQSGLSLLGYYSGELDGQRDADTERAIRAFQQEWHLTPTGEANAELVFYVGAATGSAAANMLRDAASNPIVDASGTGFFISDAGHVITNAHVVDGCSRVTFDGEYELAIVATDEDLDLALLKADPSSQRKPLRLRTSNGVRLAEQVVLAGFPLQQVITTDMNVTSGIVSALSGPEQDENRFQMTAPAQAGNSGGPVIDRAGNVIGVAVAKLDAMVIHSETGDFPQNINFAVSLDSLRAFLDRFGVKYEAGKYRKLKTSEDLADIARVSTIHLTCEN